MRRLVIEADGGSRGNPGPAAYGAVVVDAISGQVLVEVADHIGTATNNVAEYEGLIAGLRAAAQIDPDAAIEARLDSKLVVEQMSGGWRINHPKLREQAAKVRALAPAGRIRFTWVPRAQNARADRLANEALDAAAARRPARIERWAAGPADSDPFVDAAAVEAGNPMQAAMQAGTPVQASSRSWPPADLGSPSSLILVRHGVTQHSLEHRFSGRGGVDPPLVELGRQQAQAVAEELRRRGGADVVVTSPMRRTRQTAQIVADLLGIGAVHEVPDLAEADFGVWDSLTYEEVGEGWPDEFDRWMASTDIAPPQGESFAQLRIRADRARADLLARFPAQRVIVVSHVSPIKALVQIVLGAPASSAFRVALPPCSLTTLSWWGDGMTVAHGIAEIGHLHGLMQEWT